MHERKDLFRLLKMHLKTLRLSLIPLTSSAYICGRHNISIHLQVYERKTNWKSTCTSACKIPGLSQSDFLIFKRCDVSKWLGILVITYASHWIYNTHPLQGCIFFNELWFFPPPFFSDLIIFPISLLHQPQRPVPNSNTVTECYGLWGQMGA
jgi:hypothetical protein